MTNRLTLCCIITLLCCLTAHAQSVFGPVQQGSFGGRRPVVSAASPYWTDTNSYSVLLTMQTTNAAGPLDTSGNGNNFSNMNAATYTVLGTNQFGDVNYGYYLDNVSSYLDGGGWSGLNAISNFTIGAWFKITETLGAYSICFWEKGADNNNVIYLFNNSVVSNFLYAVRDGSTVYDLEATSDFLTGQWFSVVSVYNGQTATATNRYRLYFNGVYMPAVTATLLSSPTDSNANSMKIGKSTAAIPNTFMGGYVDEWFCSAGNTLASSWSIDAITNWHKATNPTNNLRSP